MGHSRGFSLIETLVAITIASIAVLALMKIVSQSTALSTNILQRFDSSIMMSLVQGEANETLDGRTLSVDEILSSRYNIDHSVIRESLQSVSYEIELLPKESINPLMDTPASSTLSSTINTLALQKVMLKNPHEHSSFFRLTSEQK
ncbi:MAG: prepilin-type N-terminal cleavage/methylation domain-containing protein [Sulfuricurvum sp.]|uniref:type IV pilus modification PilV family protein n=1 Tax=Sulfuricurvum sp. TaxID=2025608 RepID=UPI002639E390|nr:prepilin-type N-terminal cleavage/methylation domain-containing protein [Sulfuricurvum sp.]MDD2828315.1 prepilin-type N-terminal cleavage/methylation domain-containing protein [Sulfuricurvum sp.]MDD4949730.1 prepilin-type N-terminal cleavage/methylation domain-containing protein [Sulfuricurvum sp.]